MEDDNNNDYQNEPSQSSSFIPLVNFDFFGDENDNDFEEAHNIVNGTDKNGEYMINIYSNKSLSIFKASKKKM